MVHKCSTCLWCSLDANRLVSDIASYCRNMKKRAVSDAEKGLWPVTLRGKKCCPHLREQPVPLSLVNASLIQKRGDFQWSDCLGVSHALTDPSEVASTLTWLVETNLISLPSNPDCSGAVSFLLDASYHLNTVSLTTTRLHTKHQCGEWLAVRSGHPGTSSERVRWKEVRPGGPRRLAWALATPQGLTVPVGDLRASAGGKKQLLEL